MRLALKFGEWDVDRWLVTVPAGVFVRWMAYSELEPWDETRADLRAGSVVAAVYNQWGQRGRKPLSAQDCALKFGPDAAPRRQTVEEIHANVMAWAWGCRARAGLPARPAAG